MRQGFAAFTERVNHAVWLDSGGFYRSTEQGMEWGSIVPGLNEKFKLFKLEENFVSV